MVLLQTTELAGKMIKSAPKSEFIVSVFINGTVTLIDDAIKPVAVLLPAKSIFPCF